MIKLNVSLTLTSGKKIPAGELVVADPDVQGRLQGQFRYSPNYLDFPESFPLDPIHLPLTQEVFNADRPYSGVHGVFEDSLPDDWGRRILARRYTLIRKDQRVPQLLALLGAEGMGAIGYVQGTIAFSNEQEDDVDGRHLTELQRLATEFEKDATSINDEMSLLFRAGSSPGGARPKALIIDRGIRYLAKFNSIKDQFDVVALEAAAMELARRAGIEAALSRCVTCGAQKVLLVERFDVSEGGPGRNHMISMQTLLKADGYYNAGYNDLAGVVRRISTEPAQDLLKLFKQMIFNVMIGNTDDHLKNFCMMFDGAVWKLSPAFDLVPNIGLNHEHVLRIGSETIVASRENLYIEAKNFGIKSRGKADKIIDAVFSKVSSWREVFIEHNVPSSDIKIIGRDITERMAKLDTRFEVSD